MTLNVTYPLNKTGNNLDYMQVGSTMAFQLIVILDIWRLRRLHHLPIGQKQSPRSQLRALRYPSQRNRREERRRSMTRLAILCLGLTFLLVIIIQTTIINNYEYNYTNYAPPTDTSDITAWLNSIYHVLVEISTRMAINFNNLTNALKDLNTAMQSGINQIIQKLIAIINGINKLGTQMTNGYQRICAVDAAGEQVYDAVGVFAG